MIRTVYGDYKIVNKQETFWGGKSYKEFDIYQLYGNQEEFVTHVVGSRDESDTRLIRKHLGDFNYE